MKFGAAFAIFFAGLAIAFSTVVLAAGGDAVFFGALIVFNLGLIGLNIWMARQ